MRKIHGLPAALLLAMTAPAAFAAGEDFWSDAAAQRPAADAPPAREFRALTLDAGALQRFLDGAARQGEALALPRPQGGFNEFVLSDSGVMPPQLAAKYPQIRSYVGVAADGTQARIDVSPLGLQAMVFAGDGVWMVQPQGRDRAEYMSFARGQLQAGKDFRCGVHGRPAPGRVDAALRAVPAPMTVTGAVKRNYVAAVAANSAYVAAISPSGGATVATGLAGVVATMNRVNQVYEQDFSIHMTLYANNDQLIYPSAGTDPYPNDDTAVDMNTSHLNTTIGVGSYDIGHVLTTGSGGVAGLGVVCQDSWKGDGTTGSGNPTGDAFWIDYVAHEMGHQFGGDHTFNSTTSFCSGNRNGATAFEPGSGSTVMAYAGICGAADLQSNSDPYFTASSLSEIHTYTAGDGAGCAGNTANPNAAPVIAPLSNFIIPARTPFVLTGSATTASGGTLSYAWEQNDTGATNNNLANDPGTGPIIRSLTPAATGVRVIPRLSNLLAGTTLKGEILPTTNRTLHFRLTVRDNVPGGGTSSSADMSVQSVATGSAFKVNAPNTAVNWAGLSSQNVTWDVAGTNAAPISCSQVGIDLSSDGGLTFPQNLGTFPNTGSASITVPNTATTHARLRVSCIGNIFFNVSAPDFTITPGSDAIFDDSFEL
ncbi:reprolysin-like metallopeptidase [Tahibacter harae]|uniref:M12 family metallo-peptidase n=1 Tax=Tahibacter harae TaxID=2963937 RepID=A0ABT1QTX4_9GAMM|nr:zinc-dependent metalloprotease family protein [Tahibacter harae]MCQ4165719.1 M12 family metallo-peptidase [Tahibacter harae]